MAVLGDRCSRDLGVQDQTRGTSTQPSRSGGIGIWLLFSLRVLGGASIPCVSTFLIEGMPGGAVVQDMVDPIEIMAMGMFLSSDSDKALHRALLGRNSRTQHNTTADFSPNLSSHTFPHRSNSKPMTGHTCEALHRGTKTFQSTRPVYLTKCRKQKTRIADGAAVVFPMFGSTAVWDMRSQVQNPGSSNQGSCSPVFWVSLSLSLLLASIGVPLVKRSHAFSMNRRMRLGQSGVCFLAKEHPLRS